ncbi:hypothetical protein ACFW1A_04195 [Kitasatospora sp. NPDC058965]|uniref:hypothetical protein n=1 Tax=Kitasatospora sp. NPDC058965 TaxID=3346682 RepID=UPI0036BFAF85
MHQHARRTARRRPRRVLLILIAVLVVGAGATAFVLRDTDLVPKDPASVTARPCPANLPLSVQVTPTRRGSARDALVPDRPAVATYCRYDLSNKPDGWKLRDSAELRGAALDTLVGALDAAPRAAGDCPDVQRDGEMVGELYLEYPSGPGVAVLVRALTPVPDACESARSSADGPFATAAVNLPLR